MTGNLKKIWLIQKEPQSNHLGSVTSLQRLTLYIDTVVLAILLGGEVVLVAAAAAVLEGCAGAGARVVSPSRLQLAAWTRILLQEAELWNHK